MVLSLGTQGNWHAAVHDHILVWRYMITFTPLAQHEHVQVGVTL